MRPFWQLILCIAFIVLTQIPLRMAMMAMNLEGNLILILLFIYSVVVALNWSRIMSWGGRMKGKE